VRLYDTYFIVSFKMRILASLLRETVTPFARVCAGVSFSSRVKDGSSRETRCKAADKILAVFETSKAIIQVNHTMGLFDNFKKAEVRSLENPNAPVSAENFPHIMGWGDL
jgi:hypothetical protein